MNAPLPDAARLQAGQQALAAHLAVLRQTAWTAGSAAAPDPRDTIPSLARIAELFALSRFEAETLLLAAAPDLDGAIAALCGARHGDPSRTWPSFGLALACLDDPHWSALSPGRPLRYWRVIAVDPQPTITTGRLTLDERILHFLLGVEYLDARLEGVITEVGGGAGLSPSQQRITERLAELVRARRERGAWPAVQLLGPPGAAKRAVASAACAQLGWRLRTVQAGALPTEPVALAELRRLWEREAVLSGSALLIEAEDASPDALTALHAFATDLQGVVLVSAREAVPALGHAPLLSVERPVAGERSALWTAALGARAAGLNGMVERLGDQFDLDLDALHGASAEALAGSDGTQSLGGALWRACRERPRPALDDLAQRIDAASRRSSDVVLPPAQMGLLAQIVAQVRSRGTVYERWGFAAASSRGLGITALFAGSERHRQDDGRRGARRTSSTSISTGSTSRGRQQVHRRDREEPAPRVRRRRGRAARCCCSTRPTRCSASAPRSRTATTATPTSRSATCCSGWSAIAGSRS